MNKLCKAFGIGLLSLPLIYGCSGPKRSSEVEKLLAEEKKAEQRTEQEVRYNVSSSIKSVPDSLTDFNKTLAEKAMKVAQYVVSDPKSKYLVCEYGNIILNSEIKFKSGRVYKLLVYNFNEGKTGHRDYMKISMVKGKKESGEMDSFEVKDTGFDGKPDSGSCTRNGVLDETVFDASLGEINNRDTYNYVYEIALDELVRFYEKKK